jgi:alpha-D-xyloside xylohydrolase
MSQFNLTSGKLVWSYDGHKLQIEPWGENSLRVRATVAPELNDKDWALLPAKPSAKVEVSGFEDGARIVNGNISAVVNGRGQLRFYNQDGKLLLEEFWRTRFVAGQIEDLSSKYFSPLTLEARDLKPIPGGKYELRARFEAQPGEKIYGMGQYQQPFLNVKGCTLELAQRNSQASVPFMMSSLGYGLLWNNPAIGEVSFANNVTTWLARVTEQMDYWITAGDTPAQISRQYAAATGTAPMLPEYAAGFWQCKLRYRTQDELLAVAREYKRRGLPLSVIVADFFHWPNQGEWRFDPREWPDPKAMVEELKELGIELMVSIWPTVDNRTENYKIMKSKGYLVKTERGVPITMTFLGNTTFFDATHPGAQRYIWEQAKKNYHDIGVRIFWLDEAEPEFSVYDFENYRYHLGPVLEVGNFYPRGYAKAFYEGMQEAGQTEIVNLLRCAWAGSQRYGALVWSGDINSTFGALRNQIMAGLNMGIAGIPWWTTDIGGFDGGDVNDPAFQELLIRWFQWGVFCPVTRLHGYRQPSEPAPVAYRDGIAQCDTGAPNEIWSFGEDNYAIMKGCLDLRERLRPYIMRQMKSAHETGAPVMRPLFFDFPDQAESWQIEDQYMFGPDILVAPVLEAGQRSRKVWLPEGCTWVDLATGARRNGGQWCECAAPIEAIPVFIREKAEVYAELAAA